jgi:hypothetical protein
VCRAIISTFPSKAQFHPRRETPSKPSKPSQRKAAKAARQEKKLQSRVPLSGGDTYERQSPAPIVPLTEPEVRPVPEDRSSVEPPIDHLEPLPLKATANRLRDEAPLNGQPTRHADPRPTPPREPPNVSSIPQPDMLTSVDQSSSQPLHLNLPAKQAPPSSGSALSPSDNPKGLATSTSPTHGTDVEAEKLVKKGHNVLVRTLWTFIMLGGFLGQLNTLYRAARGLTRIV